MKQKQEEAHNDETTQTSSDPCEKEEEPCPVAPSCEPCIEPVAPVCCGCVYDPLNDIYVRGEYLFVRPWLEGSELAGTGPIFPGDIKALTYDWESAGRVAVGSHFCDTWGLELAYTYLKSDGSKHISAAEIFPFVVPEFVSGGLTFDLSDEVFESTVAQSFFHTLSSSACLTYQVVDIELRKNLSCQPCFRWDVLIGIEGAFIEDKLFNHLSGDVGIEGNNESDQTTRSELLFFTLQANQKWDFKGWGIRIGSMGQYLDPCGWLIYGSAKFDILFGRFHNTYFQQVTQLDTNTFFPDYLSIFRSYYNISGSEKFNDFVGNGQFVFGLGYHGCFDCLTYTLKAGWEMDYWINLVQFRRGLSGKASQAFQNIEELDFHFTNTNLSTKTGQALGLQGLILSLELSF